MKRKKIGSALLIAGSLIAAGNQVEINETRRKKEKLSVNMPLNEVRSIHSYYSNPENIVEIQLANEKTLSVWQNMSSYFKTSLINRNNGISYLPEEIDETVRNIRFRRSGNSENESVGEFFQSSNMDAMIVIKDGNIIHEEYKTMRPRDKHNWFSVGKTVSSTLLTILQEEERVDFKKPVSTYIPELKGSEWDNVSVEATLDMATGLDSTEHEVEGSRLNPESGWYRWAVSIGLFYSEDKAKEDVYDVLRSMKRVKPAYESFEYNSINTFILEMIVENVTGKTFNEVFSEYVWSKTGMQNDAYVAITKDSHSMGFGFISSGLRDLARYGMIYTPSWNKVSRERIVSENIIKAIQIDGRKAMYANGAVGKIMVNMFHEDKNISNRYQWDAVFEDGDFYKGGVGGQGLYISPDKDIVIAWFSNGTENHEATMARVIAKSL